MTTRPKPSPDASEEALRILRTWYLAELATVRDDLMQLRCDTHRNFEMLQELSQAFRALVGHSAETLQ
jgi:hypothetical protein